MNKNTPKFQFSNVVVVRKNLVGVVVYVRSWNRIEEFDEEEIKHLVYDKEI